MAADDARGRWRTVDADTVGALCPLGRCRLPFRVSADWALFRRLEARAALTCAIGFGLDLSDGVRAAALPPALAAAMLEPRLTIPPPRSRACNSAAAPSTSSTSAHTTSSSLPSSSTSARGSRSSCGPSPSSSRGCGSCASSRCSQHVWLYRNRTAAATLGCSASAYLCLYTHRGR